MIRLQVKLGLLPGAGGTQRLPKLIPITEALSIMLTGKTLPAVKAKKIGLIDCIVQPIGAGIKPADENNYNYLEQVNLFRNSVYFAWNAAFFLIFVKSKFSQTEKIYLCISLFSFSYFIESSFTPSYFLILAFENSPRNFLTIIPKFSVYNGKETFLDRH